MSGPRQAAFVFVFVTVLLDMLAIGIVIPVLPTLIKGFLDGSTERAASWVGLFGAVWALMQFLFSPVQGALSDRFGRRAVILASNFGLAFDYAIMAWAPTLLWLLIGRIISGITAASVSTATAYIADVTPPEQRAARFGLLSAAFGIGFILGPALGGVLGDLGPRVPFWVAGVISLGNAAWGVFVLPESLPHDRRAPWNWRRANPVGSLSLLRGQQVLGGLAIVHFLVSIAHSALPNLFVLYAEYRYSWGPAEVGIALGLSGACSMLVQGVLVGPVVRRIGERRALALGLIGGAAGFAIFALATTAPVFYVGIPVLAIWGFATPSLQSFMTSRVQPTQQGRLQGALGSIQGIASMIGPPLFTGVFALAIGPEIGWDLPGAGFLLAAILVAAGSGLSWIVTRPGADLAAANPIA